MSGSPLPHVLGKSECTKCRCTCACCQKRNSTRANGCRCARSVLQSVASASSGTLECQGPRGPRELLAELEDALLRVLGDAGDPLVRATLRRAQLGDGAHVAEQPSPLGRRADRALRPRSATRAARCAALDCRLGHARGHVRAVH
eukprot:87081-Pleurochrysis_carterae.AAC.2